MPQAMICFPVGGGGTPDNTLPDGGVGAPGTGRPDNTLPNLPNYPNNGLPGGGVVDPGPGRPVVLPSPPPVRPDNTLPPVIWPGIPAHPLPPVPGQPLPVPPGSIWPPLPPAAGTDKLLVLVLIPGVGARWTVIDPTLRPTPPIAPTPTPR